MQAAPAQLTIEPEEFAPAQPEPPPPKEAADEPAAAEARGLGKDFQLRLDLNFQGTWVHVSEAERAAEYLGMKPEDWHALPEPPERRPQPD